jgi:homoserine O-succinyltransferase
MSAAAQSVRPAPFQRPLVIGLVNNMGASAMASTQAQFAGLLQTTGRPARLVSFTMRPLPDRPRDYLPIDAITDRCIDAIIVTGMELTTSNLRDEWLWPSFTRLHDWCERESMPAIWSCLAAHAAVLHRDGIARQRLGAKLSGVFACQRSVRPHRLTAGLPARWHAPHSRFNGLPGEALTARGYTILSAGDAVGADIFTHGDKPASFYFQGHPEYHPLTLLKEFLRDLRQYVAGENAICPAVPLAYLDTPAEEEFMALREWALAGQDVMPSAHARATHVTFRHSWTAAATQLYANWLDIVAAHAFHRPAWAMTASTGSTAGTAVR